MPNLLKVRPLTILTALLTSALSVNALSLPPGAKGGTTLPPGAGCNSLLAQALKSLPPGNWTLAITPYYGAEWQSLPVDVTSVTTEATKGLTAESVLLRNLSSKKVTAVRLRWYLREKRQTSALLRGETPLIDVNIPAEGEQRLSHGVVTFAAVSQPLVKEGKISGNYVIEILASSAVYEDGSVWNVSQVLNGEPTWQVGQERKQAVISRPEQGTPDILLNGTLVNSYVKTTGTLPKPQGCQDQHCGFCGACSCYQCIPADGSCCGVNTCTSCTNARCLRVGCQF